MLINVIRLRKLELRMQYEKRYNMIEWKYIEINFRGRLYKLCLKRLNIYIWIT
jgi:hypothetical protein